MEKVLKAGVVGSGVFGGFHARKYAEMEGVALAGIFDTHPERCFAMAEQHGVEAWGDLDDLLAVCDIVTVASPATTHADAALACLKAGKSVYVEKPLATTLEDADRLIAEAAKQGVVLACGHQERVVSQAMGLLDIPEKPLLLDAVRKGTPSPRSQDVSVVLDLMIHDIDLALSLTDAEPLAVEAEGDGDDIRAGGDLRRRLHRRVHRRPQRRRPRADHAHRLSLRRAGDRLRHEGLQEQHPVPPERGLHRDPGRRDPLGASVAGFVAAVRGLSPRPVVTGEEAARALDLALAVEQAAGF